MCWKKSDPARWAKALLDTAADPEKKARMEQAAYETVIHENTWDALTDRFLAVMKRDKESVMPDVSVIVPVYNIKTLLPRCVASLQAQTWQDFEVWLVDDGSTDGSGELCDEYAVKDARIHALHKENGGQGSARDLGLDHARG